MLSSMSIYFILLYFFVYGFLGWCTEVGFAAFKTHHFVNRGFLNGPICPIYGVGVTAVITVLTPYKSDFISSSNINLHVNGRNYMIMPMKKELKLLEIFQFMLRLTVQTLGQIQNYSSLMKKIFQQQ